MNVESMVWESSGENCSRKSFLLSLKWIPMSGLNICWLWKWHWRSRTVYTKHKGLDQPKLHDHSLKILNTLLLEGPLNIAGRHTVPEFWCWTRAFWLALYINITEECHVSSSNRDATCPWASSLVEEFEERIGLLPAPPSLVKNHLCWPTSIFLKNLFY